MPEHFTLRLHELAVKYFALIEPSRAKGLGGQGGGVIFSRNLGLMDRIIRTLLGVAMMGTGVALIRYRLIAVILVVAGLATVVGAALGH